MQGEGASLKEIKKTGNDPHRNSLRLLPSGPDRVGEGHAHHQPSTAYIGYVDAGSKPFLSHFSG